MSTGLYVGYSGASAIQQKLEAISNNVANSSTPAYRRDLARFDTVVAAERSFARAPETSIDLSPGSHRQDGNPIHAAIDGEGWFVVEGKDGGEYYTRRGDFKINAEGQLSLPNGRPVMGTGGALIVPGGENAQLSDDGTLRTRFGPIGRLRIVEFKDTTNLAKAGESMISAGPNAGPTDVDNPRVAVGAVEDSNVNVSQEMVELIETSRSFEAAMKALQISDELSQRLIQISNS